MSEISQLDTLGTAQPGRAAHRVTIELDALGPVGPYRAARRVVVADVAGEPVAELSQVPALYVRRAVSALRSASPLPPAERFAALAAAGELFAGEVGGISLSEHESLVARVSGVSLSAVRGATQAIVERATSAEMVVDTGCPRGVAKDWKTGSAADARAVWARRGEVLAVHAPGNHPAVQGMWLEALALGYRVAVRPSIRDPFTPYRLVMALRAGGFGTDQVVFLPTAHEVADDLIDAADRALVYGGDDLAAKYGAVPTVLIQGPGRSKILLADGHGENHLDTVVESVSGNGATGCVNTTAVFVEGDPAPVAEALARRMSAIPSSGPDDGEAVLPAFSLARARSLETYLRSKIGDARLIGDGQLTEELPGGGAVLRPAVILLDHLDQARTGIEFPFPCVWVAPWSAADGITPLENSLVLTVFTADDALLDQLIAAESIRNVHIGDYPTCLMYAALPHDGYLSEFLMRAKTVIGR